MNLGPKYLIQSVLRRLGYVLVRNEHFVSSEELYCSDGLATIHNDSFRDDPDFIRAYSRGLVAADGNDPRHAWRVLIAIWAARLATRAGGDFVECGVNAGFMSSAIMQALDWNEHDRTFFLIDSFTGPRMDQFTAEEKSSGFTKTVADAVRREAYVTDIDRITKNFAEWHSARIVQGYVPEILATLERNPVAFLHLDMNAAIPERDALAHFWPLLADDGVVLLDDYAYFACEAQQAAIDELGLKLGFTPLSLPTGQGLIVKGV